MVMRAARSRKGKPRCGLSDLGRPGPIFWRYRPGESSLARCASRCRPNLVRRWAIPPSVPADSTNSSHWPRGRWATWWRSDQRAPRRLCPRRPCCRPDLPLTLASFMASRVHPPIMYRGWQDSRRRERSRSACHPLQFPRSTVWHARIAQAGDGCVQHRCRRVPNHSASPSAPGRHPHGRRDQSPAGLEDQPAERCTR